VAEHSFKVPMPNSPLLFQLVMLGACFSHESKLTTEGFVLAFWLRRVVAMAMGLIKNKAKNGPCLFFHHLPTTN